MTVKTERVVLPTKMVALLGLATREVAVAATTVITATRGGATGGMATVPRVSPLHHGEQNRSRSRTNYVHDSCVEEVVCHIGWCDVGCPSWSDQLLCLVSGGGGMGF